MLHTDILTCNISAPGAASQACGHRHAIGEGTGVAPDLRLANHDAAHRSHQRQSMDVILIKGIDAAGMPFATDLEDVLNHLQRVVEPAVSEDRENRRELFAGEY